MIIITYIFILFMKRHTIAIFRLYNLSIFDLYIFFCFFAYCIVFQFYCYSPHYTTYRTLIHQRTSDLEMKGAFVTPVLIIQYLALQCFINKKNLSDRVSANKHIHSDKQKQK